MRRVCALFISVVFLFGLAVSPAFAVGDKVQGDQAVSDNFGGNNSQDPKSTQTPNNEDEAANEGPDNMGNQV